MTSPDMDDEAMKAMARRIASETKVGAAPEQILRGDWDNSPVVKAAYAAIIETRDRDAALAEADAERSNACFQAEIGGDAGKDRNAARYRTALRIAAAIRSGQQFRKDV